MADTALSTKEILIRVWAAVATAAAIMFAGLALYLFLHPREVVREIHAPAAASSSPSAPSPTAPAPNLPEAPSPGFAALKETDIPGRYRFFEGGQELGTMLFKEDHTFINKDGTTFRQYRWDISPEGLVVVWQRSTSRFTVMEKPGVYIAPRINAPEHRLERLE